MVSKTKVSYKPKVQCVKSATFHKQDRCTQADKKNQPHVKAHLVFPTAYANALKTKRAFTTPPPPKMKN